MNKQAITLTTGETFTVDTSTLGAALLFKKETGKEITDADISNLEDLAATIWSGAAAAAEVVGKEFPYTVQQFANRIGVAELREWAKRASGDTSAVETKGSKKKKASAS